MNHHPSPDDLAALAAKQYREDSLRATFIALSTDLEEIAAHQQAIKDLTAQMLKRCEDLPRAEVYLTGDLDPENGNSLNPEGASAPEDNLHVRVISATVQALGENVVRDTEVPPDSLGVKIGATVLGKKDGRETVSAWIADPPIGIEIRLDPDGDPLPL